VHGTEPASWRLGDLVGPLVLGFVVQVVLGSVTHLVPAIGPGTPTHHARQRLDLGRVASWRFGGWNIGVAFVTVGQLSASGEATMAGTLIVIVAGFATVVLLATSLRR
jgi:hypothetical protein